MPKAYVSAKKFLVCQCSPCLISQFHQECKYQKSNYHRCHISKPAAFIQHVYYSTFSLPIQPCFPQLFTIPALFKGLFQESYRKKKLDDCFVFLRRFNPSYGSDLRRWLSRSSEACKMIINIFYYFE